MWLALDLGNSAIKGGFFEGTRLTRSFRLEAATDGLPGDLSALLQAHLGEGIVERAGLASVRTDLVPAVAASLKTLTGLQAEPVHPNMKLPFKMAYETPHTLGADRLAAAAAAWAQHGRGPGRQARPVVAVDAGTAVTYEVIDREGVYRGGAIAPGPQLLRFALSRGTAQLPDVPLELPRTLVGRSTTEAIQSGLLFGFLDGVSGMLARLSAQYGPETFFVATGGWSALLANHIAALQAVDPHLVLRGIRLLMDLNPST